MRFGKFFLAKHVAGFEYVNYELLKFHLGSADFADLLCAEIARVDRCVAARACPLDVCALNFVAVLKIWKKACKHGARGAHSVRDCLWRARFVAPLLQDPEGAKTAIIRLLGDASRKYWSLLSREDEDDAIFRME